MFRFSWDRFLDVTLVGMWIVALCCLAFTVCQLDWRSLAVTKPVHLESGPSSMVLP